MRPGKSSTSADSYSWYSLIFSSYVRLAKVCFAIDVSCHDCFEPCSSLPVMTYCRPFPQTDAETLLVYHVWTWFSTYLNYTEVFLEIESFKNLINPRVFVNAIFKSSMAKMPTAEGNRDPLEGLCGRHDMPWDFWWPRLTNGSCL